jgi:hypothetical protein
LLQPDRNEGDIHLQVAGSDLLVREALKFIKRFIEDPMRNASIIEKTGMAGHNKNPYDVAFIHALQIAHMTCKGDRQF